MSLPKTMKAAVVHNFKQPLKIEELPVKEPQANEALIKVVASGVCHTDLHAADGDWPVKPNLPLVPGHEGVGYVAAVGNGVKDVKEGDAVGVPWLYTACGSCDYCTTGWETLCESQLNAGYFVNGGYAEYILADARYLGHLPKGVNFMEIAPILCAGVTVYKGLKETEVKPGEWVAIFGIGGLGHVAVQYAKAMGMNVASVDIDDAKLELAKQKGADLTVNSKNQEPADFFQKELGSGVHGVLVTAVHPDAFRKGLASLRRKGTMAINGLPADNTFEVPIFETILNRRTIRGSIVGTRKDLREAIEFATSGKVKAHVAGAKLEDINGVLAKMKKGGIDGRIVLDIAEA